MNLQSLIAEKGLPLLSCLPSDFIDEVIAVLVTHKKNAAAVIDTQGVLVGILTDHDVMRAVHAQQDSAKNIYSEHVMSWMTKPVITASPETSLSSALDMMGKHHIRHLVVAEHGKPTAIVSVRDILRTLHEEKSLEINVLRDIAIAARASHAA